MDTPTETIATTLRRLLSACDGVAERRDAIDVALDKGDRAELQAARTAHRRAVRRVVRQLHRDLLEGRLAPLLPRTVTRPEEAYVALRLLSSRITDGPTGTPGRTLLGQLHPSPVDLLAGAAVLDQHAPLRRSGVVVATDDEDPLDREYRFGDARYADACRLLGGSPRTLIAPYADGAEHLADWHRLALAYRRRATLLFGEERMGGLAAVGPETITDANHALDVQRERMVARLMATPDRHALPTLDFQRRYGLGELEMVLVATLLYQPLLAGVPATPLDGCAKVVAAREVDLLDTAALLAAAGALRRHALVRFADPALDDAEGIGAVALTPQAEAELMAGHRRVPGIRPGEQSAFLHYLDGLDDSVSFFRDLGIGDPAARPPDAGPPGGRWPTGREETPPAA